MPLKHCLFLSLFVIACMSFSIFARADTLVLGLDETSRGTLGANTALSQDVQASANTTIDGFAFFMSDPSGAPVTYSISDLTTGSTLFSETFDDTTLDPTLTSVAIPAVSQRAWVELYLSSPLTLDAGSDVYAFSISGVGALDVGEDPTTSTEDGLAGVGSPEAGLRVWGLPAVAPEPTPLILLGSGMLALFGVMSGRINP
jgi:hypothetical protein